MTRPVIYFCLAALLCLQGCGDSRESDRLNGYWVCDGGATLRLMQEAAGMSASQLQAGIAILQSMSLEIDSEAETLAISLGSSVESSSYSVSQVSGSVFSLILPNATATAELKDNNTLFLTDSRTPNRTIVFKRQR